MLTAIIERIRTGLAIRELRKLPAVSTGRILIEENWLENQEAIKDFSPDFVKEQGERLMEEVVKIAVSPSPLMANREMLTNCLCEMAQFQVLTIDPLPAEDRTGLRGQLGITGELKPRLFELYQADKGLQEFFHTSEETPKNWDDVWNPVLFRYRQSHAWTHVFHGLRYVFDDCNKGGRDWFRPFVAAMCGFQESTFRNVLGMPSAFDRTSDIMPELKPVILSLFMKCVMDGSRFPDLEWENRTADIEKGDYAWRANSWLTKDAT